MFPAIGTEEVVKRSQDKKVQWQAEEEEVVVENTEAVGGKVVVPEAEVGEMEAMEEVASQEA